MRGSATDRTWKPFVAKSFWLSVSVAKALKCIEGSAFEAFWQMRFSQYESCAVTLAKSLVTCIFMMLG